MHPYTTLALAVCGTLLLPTTPTLAQLPPWALGDTTTRCYTSSKNWTIPGEAIDVKGITVNLLNIPPSITAEQPLSPPPTIQVHLDPIFNTYPNNLALMTPMPNSTDFQTLCWNRLPLNGTTACPEKGSDETNCCIPHVQFHACRQDMDPACEPWAFRNMTGVRPADMVFTSARSKQGYPETNYDFSDWTLPNAETWIVLAHVKVLNIQCASGTIVKVKAAPSLPGTPLPTSASESSSSFPTWGIAVSVVGGVVLLAASFAGVYVFGRYRHKKSKGTTHVPVVSKDEPSFHDVISVPIGRSTSPLPLAIQQQQQAAYLQQQQQRLSQLQQQQQLSPFGPTTSLLTTVPATTAHEFRDSIMSMSNHMSLPQGTPVSTIVVPAVPAGMYPGPPATPAPGDGVAPGLYIAKVDYTPVNPDEMLVRVGQAVQIQGAGQDAGWAVGENLATKRHGCVPLVVLQPVSTVML
ncbi:hypothetical protein SpCBS45565_g06391 [Spizellomyces sp. 'palustris']|nr:hypothetical protein SpCBS45565_g06391 [Spizellomyces sp. 'palustris']